MSVRLRHAARSSARWRRSSSSSCFNFFLFRVVESDPVANLFRGRNLTPGAARRAARAVRARRLEARAVRPLSSSRPSQLNFGRSYTTNEPVMSRDLGARLADDRARRHLDAALGRVRHADRHRRRLAAADRRRTTACTGFTMATYSMPDFWLGMLLLVDVRRHARPVPGRRDHATPAPTRRGSRSSSTRRITCSCPR